MDQREPSSVWQTDNVARVRDGYISESTRGHPRALTTRTHPPICRPNTIANGKEGVDGSSPSEGFALSPAQQAFSLSAKARRGGFSVHRASTNVHRGDAVAVEEADRVLAAVAGEVAVVAVDHGQACAHLAGEVEGGDAGTEREGGEGVAQIVDAPERFDSGGSLGGFPVAVAKVVQVEVAAVGRGEEKL